MLLCQGKVVQPEPALIDMAEQSDRRLLTIHMPFICPISIDNTQPNQTTRMHLYGVNTSLNTLNNEAY